MGSVDPEEYARLVQARDDFRERGLVSSFETEEELWRKATADITRTIREHFAPSLEARTATAEDPAAPRALLVGRIVSELNARGSRHDRLVLENMGSAAAESVTFDVVVPEGENEAFIGKDDTPVGLLPPHGAIDYPMAEAFGTASHWDIVIRWTEGDIEHESRQTMR